MQRKWFEQATKRLGNLKAICVVRPSFCSCVLINNFPYAKEDKRYIQYKKSLQGNLRLPSLESSKTKCIQRIICSTSLESFCWPLEKLVLPKNTMPATANHTLRVEHSSSAFKAYFSHQKNLEQSRALFCLKVLSILCSLYEHPLHIPLKSRKAKSCGAESHGLLPRDWQ